MCSQVCLQILLRTLADVAGPFYLSLHEPILRVGDRSRDRSQFSDCIGVRGQSQSVRFRQVSLFRTGFSPLGYLT